MGEGLCPAAAAGCVLKPGVGESPTGGLSPVPMRSSSRSDAGSRPLAVEEGQEAEAGCVACTPCPAEEAGCWKPGRASATPSPC